MKKELNQTGPQTPQSNQTNEAPAQPRLTDDQILSKMNIDFSMVRIRKELLAFKNEKYKLLTLIMGDIKSETAPKAINKDTLTRIEEEYDKLVNEILDVVTN